MRRNVSIFVVWFMSKCISRTFDCSSRHFTPAIVPQDIKCALWVEMLVCLSYDLCLKMYPEQLILPQDILRRQLFLNTLNIIMRRNLSIFVVAFMSRNISRTIVPEFISRRKLFYDLSCTWRLINYICLSTFAYQ